MILKFILKGKKRFSYGTRNCSVQHKVFHTKSFILRNGTKKVIMPGEYIELDANEGKKYK